jgi:hypothetical protein
MTPTTPGPEHFVAARWSRPDTQATVGLWLPSAPLLIRHLGFRRSTTAILIVTIVYGLTDADW